MLRKMIDERMKPVHFTMDRETLEYLDGICQVTGMDRSPTLRHIIREYAQYHGTPKVKQ